MLQKQKNVRSGEKYPISRVLHHAFQHFVINHIYTKASFTASSKSKKSRSRMQQDKSLQVDPSFLNTGHSAQEQTNETDMLVLDLRGITQTQNLIRRRRNLLGSPRQRP